MTIIKPIDIEDLIRETLNPYLTAFCRPLPATYTLPNILVTSVGGSCNTDWHGSVMLDRFTINLTCRGNNEAEALDCLRTAIGILDASQGKTITNVQMVSHYSWGNDPVRPDLAMCGATLLVSARPETINIEES